MDFKRIKCIKGNKYKKIKKYDKSLLSPNDIKYDKSLLSPNEIKRIHNEQFELTIKNGGFW
uniref:Uncharacterized protein n=1 Tax=Pithovirus LCPAC102 TaxID=2506587 RepID=A0A4D5XFD8_9VIRU|nr:MAG: hypothetical protein LCPAC102_01760 [Pithovirus LCPAC102]